MLFKGEFVNNSNKLYLAADVSKEHTNFLKSVPQFTEKDLIEGLRQNKFKNVILMTGTSVYIDPETVDELDKLFVT